MSSLIKKMKRYFKHGVDGYVAYRVLEVDTHLQQITLQLKEKAVFIKCSFTEAIGGNFLDSLTPWEACLIGGYYGRALRTSHEGGEALKKAKRMNFLLSNKHGRYQIVFENRSGQIGYIDQKTKREFIEHPLTVVNNEHIISQFDPSQACYIGMLAGIRMERALSRDAKNGTHELDRLLNNKPYLRLVK